MQLAKRERYLIKIIHFWIVIPIWLYAQDADHILLSRVVTQGLNNKAEAISIYNPTASPIDLTNYYVCDHEDYYKIAIYPDSIFSSKISGFTAKFPPNLSIEPEDTLTIVLHENYSEFYDEDFLPDLLMYGSDANSMLETVSGSIGFGNNKIAEDSEFIILFHWDGESNLIQDIDYFSWSILSGVNLNGIDKTEKLTYQNDTPKENQLYFEKKAEQYYAYSRSGMIEIGETKLGGNGITGHDETSEDFFQSWEIIKLFNLGCTNPNGINYDSDAKIDDGSCYYTTISEILTGLYIGQQVITAGVISDYFDITVYNGPHAITIEDENHNELELTIWPDNWDETLAEYASCPYSRYEIKVTGVVNEYCKDTCDNLTTDISCNDDDDCMWNSGSCVEEDCEIKYISQTYCDIDEDCIWNQDDGICEKDCTSENWECSLARIYDNTDENGDSGDWDYLPRSMQECSWQLEVQGITNVELLKTNEVSTQLVSFQNVLDGDYYHKSVMLKGVISNYFDITKYCGPHAITISEESSGNSLELTIWDNDWSDELECLTLPPFLTKEIQVTGFVGEYEGETQIQACGDVELISEGSEWNIPSLSIAEIQTGFHQNKVVTTRGTVVDYFDITVYNGPHALTIEDEQGYRLELSIWPNTFDILSSAYSYLLQPPYNRYLLSATGNVTEYEGEKQLTISGSNSITVTDTITTDGDEYTGLMVTFIIEEEYDDFVNDEDEFDREDEFETDLADQLAIKKGRISIVNVKKGSVILDINISEKIDEISPEPSNDDLLSTISEITLVGEFDVEVQEILQLSVNTVIIKPEPYVIIPTLGEKLDYSFSYPKNSRVIIRLFDLSGRFITSLVDKYYEESSTVFRNDDQSSWDGRDHFGQIVSPGTYIMHIEAMNPVTGVTHTDAAPVVVGVKN